MYKSILKYNINYDSNFKKLEVGFTDVYSKESYKYLIEFDNLLQCYSFYIITNNEKEFVDCVNTQGIKSIMSNLVQDTTKEVTFITCI